MLRADADLARVVDAGSGGSDVTGVVKASGDCTLDSKSLSSGYRGGQFAELGTADLTVRVYTAREAN